MRITTPEGSIPLSLHDEAARKLCRAENMVESILQEYAFTAETLERLRAQDKTKTARFKELLGQKLMLSQMILRLRQARLTDEE